MGWIVGIITLAIVVWISTPKILGRTKIDISGQYLSDIYQNLPKNSILIGGGETFNTLTLYAYKVAKMRPDVTPVDMTIFYGQDWYRENLKYQQANIKVGLNESVKFSDDLEFSRTLEMFANLNFNRPIFVTGYLLTQSVYANSLRPAYVPQKYQLEQHGIVYKLLPNAIPSAPTVIPVKTGIQSRLDPRLRGDDKEGARDDNIKHWPRYLESNYQKAIDLIRMEYAFSFEKTGDYFLDRGEKEIAFTWYDKANQASPKYFDQNRLKEKVAKTEKLIN